MTISRIWKVICSNVTLEILFYLHLMRSDAVVHVVVMWCILSGGWHRFVWGTFGSPLVFSVPSLAFKLLIFLSSSSFFLSLAILTLHFSFFFSFFLFYFDAQCIFGALCIFWALDGNLETISFYFTVMCVCIYIYHVFICLNYDDRLPLIATRTFVFCLTFAIWSTSLSLVEVIHILLGVCTT